MLDGIAIKVQSYAHNFYYHLVKWWMTSKIKYVGMDCICTLSSCMGGGD